MNKWQLLLSRSSRSSGWWEIICVNRGSHATRQVAQRHKHRILWEEHSKVSVHVIQGGLPGGALLELDLGGRIGMSQAKGSREQKDAKECPRQRGQYL